MLIIKRMKIMSFKEQKLNLGANNYTFNSSGTSKNLEMSLKAITFEAI